MTTPATEGFVMPAEWHPHRRCWMAWPSRGETWGEHMDAARAAYAEVATAIAGFEPVTIVANPEDVAEVSLRCGSGIACLPMALDDSWTRDIGPTFVIDGSDRVAGIDWRFNAWGGKYPDHENDDALAGAILEHLTLRRFAAPMVLEGGSIHVDGEGTVLVSEQCLLNANRNPELSREDIEGQLGAYLGIRTVIWLGDGLQDDETDGHVDNLACFVRPGVVLALACDDPDDGNFAALRDNLTRLRAARDAEGRALEVIEVPQPTPERGADGRRLAKSYVNLYIANGGVVMPAFEDANDEVAFDAVTRCFPAHKVRQVLALDIVRGGGGIHCITQQQPVGDAGRTQ